MKRILVIGCPGSGKTTFSKRLHERTSLPLLHLDAIWHKPDRTHITREEFDARLAEIDQMDAWILDGNYSRTLEMRMQMCDTVFLFDLPTEVCLEGAIARLGQSRPDVPWIDTALDPRFREEIESFRDENLSNIYALLDQYGAEKQVVVFKSRDEADEYLRKLP